MLVRAGVELGEAELERQTHQVRDKLVQHLPMLLGQVLSHLPLALQHEALPPQLGVGQLVAQECALVVLVAAILEPRKVEVVHPHEASPVPRRLQREQRAPGRQPELARHELDQRLRLLPLRLFCVEDELVEAGVHNLGAQRPQLVQEHVVGLPHELVHEAHHVLRKEEAPGVLDPVKEVHLQRVRVGAAALLGVAHPVFCHVGHNLEGVQTKGHLVH